MGQLHPQVAARFEWTGCDLLAAEIEFELLRPHLLSRYSVRSISEYPPVLEDLAVVVAEDTPAEQVVQVIRTSGGDIVQSVGLFDVYRGEQVGAGKKSLAFSLTYQAPDRTLGSAEAEEIRTRIIRALEGELGGKVRR
jgi:phenylalanyl-tRNA synthetase beta chain